MQPESLSRTRTRLRDLLDRGEAGAAMDLLQSLAAADQADVLEELPTEMSRELVARLSPPRAADVLEEMTELDAAALVTGADVTDVATVADEMAPDEAADLLGDLPREMREQALAQMRRASEVRPLLEHADESAGGLMTSEYLAFRPAETAGEVLEALKRSEPRGRHPPSLFLVDAEGGLLGAATVLDVLKADIASPMEEIADRDPRSVNVAEDRERVARLMLRYGMDSLPVVDDAGRLRGVVTLDDAAAVLEEESTEDFLQRVAVTSTGRERARSHRLVRAPISEAWRVRIPFLLITMFGGLLAGMVIDAFETALETVVALAVFIPLVMDMGGNAGTQSSTIFSRALALGQIDPDRFTRHLGRETLVGLSLGTALGVLAGGLAYLWQGEMRLALVVGIAIAATMTLATCLGFLIPYVLFRIGLDQTAGSDPIITTI